MFIHCVPRREALAVGANIAPSLARLVLAGDTRRRFQIDAGDWPVGRGGQLSALCRRLLLPVILMVVTGFPLAAAGRDYPIQPVPLTGVDIRGDFWASRIRTNREVTVWYDFRKCEETGTR